MPGTAAPSLHAAATSRHPGDGDRRGVGTPRGPVAGLDVLLVHAAAESPDGPAMVEASGRSRTWRELDAEVARVATGHGDAGVVADAGSVTAVRAALTGLEVAGAPHRPRCSVLPPAPGVLERRRSVDLADRLGPVRPAVHQGSGLTETAPVVASTLASTPVDPPLRRPHRARGGPAPGRPRGSRGRRRDPGDVGLVDAAGDLVLVDRVAETIVVSGVTVHPGEVANALVAVATRARDQLAVFRRPGRVATTDRLRAATDQVGRDVGGERS